MGEESMEEAVQLFGNSSENTIQDIEQFQERETEFRISLLIYSSSR